MILYQSPVTGPVYRLARALMSISASAYFILIMTRFGSIFPLIFLPLTAGQQQKALQFPSEFWII
jgi:hypothetical protein